MIKNKTSIVLIVAIFCSGMFLVFTSNLMTTPTTVVDNASNEVLDASVLGDVEKTITPPIDPLGLEYFDGGIWVADQDFARIYKLDPITGVDILNISIPFEPSTIASDGTYLYVANNAYGNGTVYKMKTDGTIVDSVDIPVATFYVSGLAYGDSSLWATMDEPTNYIYRINPSTMSVIGSVSVSNRYADMTWYDGLLWVVDWSYDRICAINPTTGRIMETFDGPISGTGDFGLTYNGTHFIIGDWNGPQFHWMDIPTDAGEVWNQHPAPSTNILGIDWNGTHYFVADLDTDQICILHDGTFENLANLSLPFTPEAVAVVGTYLYISDLHSPYHIFKYTFAGAQLAEYAAVGTQVQGLTYDGSYLWANGQDYKIYKLNPADCTNVTPGIATGNWADIAWDGENKVFWGIQQSLSLICEIDPTTLQATEINFTTPYLTGEYGLCFNGEHLIHGNWDNEMIYKIIIDLPSGGGIPGFSNFVLLLSVLTLIGVFFLLKQGKHYWQKI